MAKDPVLPLYYNDLTTSTQDWTDEEFGAYVRLLIHQWRQGGLPKDYQRLTRIATSLSTNWALLKGKFPEVDGMLKNPVMEEIRVKRAKHKQKQKENVQKRYQNSTKPHTKNLPLESEYENENEKLNNNKEFDFSKPDIPGDEITFPIDTKPVRTLWAGWKEYRWKQYQARYGMMGEQADLKRLQGKSFTEFEKIILEAIANKWKNLYPENQKNNSNGQGNGITAQGTLDRLNSYTNE